MASTSVARPRLSIAISWNSQRRSNYPGIQAHRHSRISLHTPALPVQILGQALVNQAGVSLPTVYSHFPDEDELFRGCTSHVADRAPTMPVNEILGASSLSAAIEKLVGAMEQQHIYYEPWSSRRMEGYVTFLAEMSVQVREQQSATIEKIMSHFLGPGNRGSMIAGCETVLSFDFWHRLVRGHGLPRSQARQILIQSLQSILEPLPDPLSTSKPRRKYQ